MAINTKEMGRIRFIDQVGSPERWLTIFAFVTHKLWERACRKFGDVTVDDPVLVSLHGGRETVMVVMQKGSPPVILIGLTLVGHVAVTEVKGGNGQERFLRAFRVIVAEELVHLRDFIAGEPLENTTCNDGGPIEHYSPDWEYRALSFAVEATGEREELLAEVEAARAAMRE